jgi:uncharacterized membrane protein (UPF0127 family)
VRHAIVGLALALISGAAQGGEMITAVLFGPARLAVEVADDQAEQQQGLMERKELGADAGMIFVYPDSKPRSFWMKNTIIPLSIAFLDERGTVINIIEEMKPVDTSIRYASEGNARYAVEANVGWFAKNGVKKGDRAKFAYRKDRVDGVAFGSTVVKVEVVDEPKTVERGLMYRDTLDADAGMLFVFPRAQRLQFWMRNTKIPLSIAFMDTKRKVLNIEDMEPFDDKKHHYSKGAAIYALEMNRGWFEKHGVKPGDVARFLSRTSERVGPPGAEAQDAGW